MFTLLMQSKVVLTPREWSSLVDRLNASSKIKEQSMRQAQMKRVADEMTGMTFMPQISERSRELASNQRSLPERAAALMRKKQVKLERIRQERAQKELEGATFAPRINDYRPANPAATNAAALQRRIGNLMQYVSDTSCAPRATAGLLGVGVRIDAGSSSRVLLARWFSP